MAYRVTIELNDGSLHTFVTSGDVTYEEAFAQGAKQGVVLTVESAKL